MDSSSSKFWGCGHTCANSGNGYKGEIERKLYRPGMDISWHGGKSQNVVVLFAASTYSLHLPGIVPHRKKERRAPAGPVGARTTTPNVTHPPPTYCLGGTSEIQLR
ncbi:hypothetical protein F511_16871 [Dorcoceras hygrometricum]|uniref:Uncharacterized protein n=1 Tax=Dorcoceras hygrometricum TaxID=472368 RepID=A0A2Z7BJ00_9LAMI|nr:hypothetical protein F511_16871 [Dorcoceras hygrometricum]